MQRNGKIKRWPAIFPLRRQRLNLTMDNGLYPMNNTGNKIRKSLLKRQEALNRFKARKEAFFLAKEQITKDIEEARNIWINTLKLLPKQEFN